MTTVLSITTDYEPRTTNHGPRTNMRLLFLSESFPTSIAGDFTSSVEAGDWYTATNLAKTHQVTVLTFARRGIPTDQKMKGVRVLRIGHPIPPFAPASFAAKLSFIRQALKTIPHLDFEVIHASTLLTQWIALQTNKKLDRKTVGRIAVMPGGLNPVNFNEFDRIIAWTQVVKNQLVSSGINTDKIDVVNGGVETDAIEKVKVVKKKNPTICSVGQLTATKKIDSVIRAVGILKKRHPSLRLMIIGDGPERKRLETLTKSLEIESKVNFKGTISLRSHVLRQIKASTLFCLPSVREGFGLATLEACAAGVPYINVVTPSIVEVTQDGQGGFLVDKPEPELLAEQIDRLLSDAKLYNTKARESLRLAKIYDWQKSAGKTERIFKKILRG